MNLSENKNSAINKKHSIDSEIENYQKAIIEKEKEIAELIHSGESIRNEDYICGKVWACYHCIYAGPFKTTETSYL